MIRMKRIGLTLAACLLTCLMAPPPTAAATPEQIDASIKKAIDFLYKQQNSFGNWEKVQVHPGPVPSPTLGDPSPGAASGLR